MPLKPRAFFFLLSLLFASAVEADVTEDDFIAKRTQNLINLCRASAEDPHYREAIHFCQGYFVGAYHYYMAETANNQERKILCAAENEPKPPTRNETIEMFVSWAQNHPEFMNELPVETQFRFLTSKWPCKK